MLRLFALRKCGPISIWLAGALSVTALARAETEAIRIEYRAPPECPSAAEFRAQVFQRATSARLASDGDAAARTFVVSIERRGEGVAGSLVVRESGASGAREVAGAQCGAVATVLALATALAIDPRASGLSQEPAEKQAAAPAPPVAATVGLAPEPSSDEPSERTSARLSAALGPSLESGVGPRLSLGGAVQLEWHSARQGSPLSAFGVELAWLEAPAYGVNGASSSFRFLLARPVLCSFELAPVSVFSVSPCLGVELGAVTGSGADLPAPSTETRLWAAGDALLRARLSASDAWFVELDGVLVLPFTRYNFVFREPDTQIYRVPTLAFSAGLRLGARL
jgi:hypothetical protein